MLIYYVYIYSSHNGELLSQARNPASRSFKGEMQQRIGSNLLTSTCFLISILLYIILQCSRVWRSQTALDPMLWVSSQTQSRTSQLPPASYGTSHSIGLALKNSKTKHLNHPQPNLWWICMQATPSELKWLRHTYMLHWGTQVAEITMVFLKLPNYSLCFGQT